VTKGTSYYDLRLTLIPGAEICCHGEPGDEGYRESMCNCCGRTMTQQDLGDLIILQVSVACPQRDEAVVRGGSAHAHAPSVRKSRMIDGVLRRWDR